MSDVALNLPFESNEIKDIAVVEFRKRLDGLTPLHGNKEYVKFALSFEVTINIWRNGEIGGGRETLAWANLAASRGEQPENAVQESAKIEGDKFASKDPNEERMDRDMPFTVESSVTKARRKVKMSKPAKK